MSAEEADKMARKAAESIWKWCGYAWPEANREGFIEKTTELIRAELPVP